MLHADDENGVPAGDPAGTLVLLDRVAALLVSVATDGPRVEEANARYKSDRTLLMRALRSLGLEYPFPFRDLWEWYGHWTQHFPKWAQRREYIGQLAGPVRDALEAIDAGVQVHDPGAPGPLTWTELEARVAGLADELRAASSQDDLQDVGRRCREILIDLAALIADAALVPDGQEAPKGADAKGWLALFLAEHARGSSGERLRQFVNATWALAQEVTHKGNARVTAYAAAQATILLVRTLQMLAADV